MRNWQLFFADVGMRMSKGVNLGDALYESAVHHNERCDLWDKLSRPVFDTENIGQIKECGLTMTEFLDLPEIDEDFQSDISKIDIEIDDEDRIRIKVDPSVDNPDDLLRRTAHKIFGES